MVPASKLKTRHALPACRNLMGPASAMNTATIQNTAQACTWDCNFNHRYLYMQLVLFSPFMLRFGHAAICGAWLAHVCWMVHACNRRTCSCIAACSGDASSKILTNYGPSANGWLCGITLMPWKQPCVSVTLIRLAEICKQCYLQVERLKMIDALTVSISLWKRRWRRPNL